MWKFSILFTLALVANGNIISDTNDDFLPLKKAEHCRSELCQLPNCRCSGLSLPKEEFHGHEKEIPQFVSVTFDDAVNTINYEQYQKLFSDLVNPDGCDARGTFYVSHEYTDYTKVNALYTQGHEIALHSVTHGTGTDYWRTASVQTIEREFGDQIEMLVTYAKLQRKDIRGMRLPYLQLSGNNTFEAGKRLNLLYDSSWPTQQFRNPAMWPYTLDFKSIQDCQIAPCPDASIPGFWISPMVSWLDKENYSCSMIDGCVYPPEDNVNQIFEWMLENFKRHYDNNRAPFGMYLHAAWFSRGVHYFAAFQKFLQHVNTLPDVYIVPAARIIQYVRNPVLGKPFKGCFKKPVAPCIPKSCAIKKLSSHEIRYMTICDRCPKVYPWLANPLGVF